MDAAAPRRDPRAARVRRPERRAARPVAPPRPEPPARDPRRRRARPLSLPDAGLGGHVAGLLLADVGRRRARLPAADARARRAPVRRHGGADRDARDVARRRRLAAGVRAAADRARPPRRRAGPARLARNEPGHGRAEARGRSRGGADARRGGARGGGGGPDRAAEPRPWNPPADPRRQRARRRDRRARRREPDARARDRRRPGAAAGAGRDGRLLRRRGGARERREARRRALGRRERAACERRPHGRGHGRRSGRRRSGRPGTRRPAPARRGARRDAVRDEPGRRAHDREGGAAVRVVIAEDLALLRDGLARLLRDNELEVVAAVADGPGLLAAAEAERPDVAIVDIRLPPTFTDEGLRAALELRRRLPGVAVLVVSQYVEHVYAAELLEEARGGGIGYLLKDRIPDVRDFVEAVRRVAGGGTALDPEVVSQLFARRSRDEPLERLTPREREVLALMAEGRSNAGIGEALVLTIGAVEKHVASIFAKLRLPVSETDNRRVLAVLAYLQQD